MTTRAKLGIGSVVPVVLALLLTTTGCGSSNDLTPTAGPDQAASVAFTAPEDGATVSSPVPARFEVHGFTVEPAGEVHTDAGHLHVMVDVPCVKLGTIIPKDEHHVHFGMGQTEGSLDLAPGKHTLCLQAGDGEHRALDLTDTITVTVADSSSTTSTSSSSTSTSSTTSSTSTTSSSSTSSTSSTTTLPVTTTAAG